MGLEDPVDAALALCGVDALCYDVSETLSGWVLYGSARQGLITLLGTLFVFCVGRRCTVTAPPAIICLQFHRGCTWWPGQAVMLARALFVLGKCGSLKDKLNACAHRCIRLLIRGRIQAAGQQKRQRPAAVLPQQTAGAVPFQRAGRHELGEQPVLSGLAPVAFAAQPAEVIRREGSEHCGWAQRARHLYCQSVVDLVRLAAAILRQCFLDMVRYKDAYNRQQSGSDRPFLVGGMGFSA